MPPIAFLALLAIALLMLAVLRLELNFRRTCKGRSRPSIPKARPQLRMAPAGGYCQPLLSTASRKG